MRPFGWAVLLLLSCTVACAGPQSSESPRTPVFEQGDVPPEALIPVAGATARIQTFTADAEKLVDLQVLVARGVDTGDEPLLVEVRSFRLDQRHGYGKISAFDADPFVPSWRSVEWDERPALERDEYYALVFMTDAEEPDWYQAVSPGIYPYGSYIYPNTSEFDLGFRIQFESAATQSSIVSSPEPVSAHPFEPLVRGGSWGERYYVWGGNSLRLSHGSIDSPSRGKDVLPKCVGSRCFDAMSTLWGSPEERAERARAATKSRGDAPFEWFDFETGALGVSCRDVCRGHGFASCVDTRQITCDAVVSALSSREDQSCLCTDEPTLGGVSGDRELIEDRVRQNFILDGRDRPRLKPGRATAGLTCTQVCEVLGPASCGDGRSCSRQITPEVSSCPPCTELSLSDGAKEFTKRSVAVGDRLVTTYGDTLQVVDPQSGKSMNYSIDFAFDFSRARLKTKGRFAIWTLASKRARANAKTIFVALDTLSGKIHRDSVDLEARQCRFGAHPQSLEGQGTIVAVCFRPNTTSIHFLDGEKRIEAPPASGLVRSWDGRTLTLISHERSTWTVGDSEWSKEPYPMSSRRLELSNSLPQIKSFVASNPNHSNLIDGHYYGNESTKMWRFNSEKEAFDVWTLPNTHDATISTDLIRAGQYVLDRESAVFKRVPATILLDVGHYAFIEASECPEQLPCRTLEAPLDQFAILDLRVEGYDTIYTRESSEIVPDEHWVNDETLGCR